MANEAASALQALEFDPINPDLPDFYIRFIHYRPERRRQCINTMKLEDYTGKLNDHNKYLRIIKKLKSRCKYIEYVLVNEKEKGFIEQFENFIISIKPKDKWWGTKSGKKSKVYKLEASKEIFQYLQQCETFCKYNVSANGDIVEATNFGINDIAFFDDEDMPLLFTTTHEGYITIRDDLIR